METKVEPIGRLEVRRRFFKGNKSGGDIGKLAVFDISEPGAKIGEKLLAMLDEEQKDGLRRNILAEKNGVYRI